MTGRSNAGSVRGMKPRTPWQLFVWPAFREAAHNIRYGFSNAWFILRGGLRRK